MAITATFLPYVGSLGDGVFYGYGYNGHGVAPSHTVGRALTDLVLERDTEYGARVRERRSGARPAAEPLRYLGTRLTAQLLERQDRSMDEGEEGRWTRSCCG